MKKIAALFFAICLAAPQAASAQPCATPELVVPGHNLFVNRIHALHFLFPYFDGSGRTLSIKESPFEASDVDFLGRVMPFSAPSGFDVHASLMATQALGAGNTDNASRGVARGARVMHSPFAPLLPDADSVYRRHDISVQNHSYGSDIDNRYDAAAAAYDASVAPNPALLHVFSAGNKGTEASPKGMYQGISGFANLTGAYKMAKNVLCVGGVDSFAQVAPFSSRGPAHDGRLKPDLVAFGPDGTSSAAALVSGTALVLQQIYAEQNAENLPPAALLRAVICNNADDIAPRGPDFSSGFGNLNALRAAQNLLNKQYVLSSLGAKDTFSHTLNLTQNIDNLCVMLAWDDPAAPADAARALFHDLDLSIISPNGSIQLPIIADHRPQAAALRRAASPGRDSLNNLEQVGIHAPQAGAYHLRVTAARLPAGTTQPFALSWRADSAARFAWHSPLRTDPLEAEREFVLFWESTLSDSLAVLEFKRADQSTWSTIQQGIDLKKKYARCLLPPAFGAAQLRLRTPSGEVFPTDTFLISKKLQVKVGFDCPDSAFLFWSPTTATARYQVYALGQRYFEPFGPAQTDTFVVLHKKNTTQTRFSVLPLSETGIMGRVYSAPDYSKQGVGCYLRSFLAEGANDQAAVVLRLEIGTTYGFKSAVFERLEGPTFLPIQTFSQADTRFQYFDTEARLGANFYRAKIRLNHGGEIVTDTLQVIFSPENQHLVYPTLLHTEQVFHVLCSVDEPQLRFALFDTSGKLVFDQPLATYRNTFDFPPAQNGVYFYQISGPRGVYFSGKMLRLP